MAKHGHTVVERNYLRRQLRELTRMRILPEIPGIDLVIYSFSNAYGASFDELMAEVDSMRSWLKDFSGIK